MPSLEFNVPNKSLQSNRVSRNRYNILFLPFIVIYKYFLWNYENLYFLLLTTFQLMTLGPFPKEWSPTGPYSTAVPLLFCVILELVSATYVWVKNYMSDYKDNSRLIDSVNNSSIMNKNIYPGDVIKLYKEEICPVDGILIDLSEKKERYAKINLALLTGESNIHYVEKPDYKLSINNFINNTTNTSPPLVEIDSSKKFSAKIHMNGKPAVTLNINDSNMIPNNAIIKSPYVYIWVVACGDQKKNICSQKQEASKKKSRLDTHITSYMLSNSSKMLISLILFMTTIKFIFSGNMSPANFVLLCLQNWICFNGIIPFSVKIFLILIRGAQSYIVNRTGSHTVNNNTLIDDIVKVDKIICDKTGTLTKNELEFSKLIQINGTSIVDVNNFNSSSSNQKIELMLMKCLGLCIHQSDGNFNTVEDQIIRYRYQLLNSRVQQDGNKITIMIDDTSYKFEYVEIAGLDFTFDRKLSSKIVQDADGKYFIFTKGSIDKIKSRVQNKYVDEISRLDNLMSFSYPDLRLLSLAYREIQPAELKLNKPLTDSYSLISSLENNLQFLGIVGIKDNIQEDVKKTISMFHNHDIFCCMCTGDRKITALAVAKEVGMIFDPEDSVDLDVSTLFNNNNNSTQNKTLIISGNRLESSMADPEKAIKLTQLIVSSKNFIAYNLIPEHKRILTDILENNNIRTLTVGDGFNDISMFERSQISVSIKGTPFVNESSNFVVDKFKDLIKLFELGVDHYYKNSLLANYTFYRCVCVVMCLATFGMINYNKLTTSIFSGFVIQAFNFLWCIAPLLVICLTTTKKHYFNKHDLTVAKNHINSTSKKTSEWVTEAFLVAVVTTLITFRYFGDSAVFNDILAMNIICLVNLRLIFYFDNFCDVISLFTGPVLFAVYMIVTGSFTI